MTRNTKLFWTVCLLAAAVFACARTEGEMTPRERENVRAEIERSLREAYDLSKPNVVDRMLALYPKTGRVISANSGRASTSRDTLEAGIRYFWENVGINMRQPKWVWENIWVDVLSPTSAVATATYTVPHLNPRNEPHVIGGAMTAVFRKEGGRWVIVQEHLSDLPPAASTATSTPPHDHH